MTVEDCRCASRIGISGICVKETKNMFEIVTTEDRLIKIPKEKSLLRIRAKKQRQVRKKLNGDCGAIIFSLRSGERAGKKFSGRTIRGKALMEL